MKDNDYELVYLAQEGNEDAINLIYQKYKAIIVKKSRSAIALVPNHGIDINDIMQEAYIGLDEAIRNYSQDTKATFYTFSMLCVDRQIANYVKKVKCGKDKILNEAVTINDSLEKTMSDGTNIEEYFIGKDSNKETAKEVRKSLTNFEKKVFDLRLKGYSFEEIAKELNRDTKSIYNTLWRIKDKFKKISKNDD